MNGRTRSGEGGPAEDGSLWPDCEPTGRDACGFPPAETTDVTGRRGA